MGGLVWRCQNVWSLLILFGTVRAKASSASTLTTEQKSGSLDEDATEVSNLLRNFARHSDVKL